MQTCDIQEKEEIHKDEMKDDTLVNCGPSERGTVR